jgi:xanthine dehydrogenase accessory factor
VSIFDVLAKALASESPVALATVIEGPHTGAKLLVLPGVEPMGSLGQTDLDRVVGRDAVGELAAGITSVRNYGPNGEARQDDVKVFIESFAAPPQMLIFGAVDFTAALCRVAKILGYRVTVCDARPVFATPQRFPLADDVIVDWPHRLMDKVGAELGPRDAVCVLTHDPKFDVPAVLSALNTKAGYIGAMGSRRTTHDRAERLRKEGVTDEQFERIYAPIGLDLGARTPEETAISVCAEIIALRSGRSAPFLSGTAGDIHRTAE